MRGFFYGSKDTLSCLPSSAIAIHRKFQARRVAEDSTHLYGEATQHRMRLSVDCYIAILTKFCTALRRLAVQNAASPMIKGEYSLKIVCWPDALACVGAKPVLQ